jgi:hypothetical protein
MMISRKLALVAFVCPVLFSGSALAGARDDVLEAMGRCTTIPDEKARLACYDAAAPRLKSALATPPPTIDHEPTKQEQQSWFGFNIGDLFGGGSSQPGAPEQFGKERTPQAQVAREREEIDSIAAGVTEVTYNAFGQFVVFLDNGQIWKQLQGDADRARFPTSKDTRVTISRGALGSYNLTINDSAKLYKVTRIR